MKNLSLLLLVGALVLVPMRVSAMMEAKKSEGEKTEKKDLSKETAEYTKETENEAVIKESEEEGNLDFSPRGIVTRGVNACSKEFISTQEGTPNFELFQGQENENLFDLDVLEQKKKEAQEAIASLGGKGPAISEQKLYHFYQTWFHRCEHYQKVLKEFEQYAASTEASSEIEESLKEVMQASQTTLHFIQQCLENRTSSSTARTVSNVPSVPVKAELVPLTTKLEELKNYFETQLAIAATSAREAKKKTWKAKSKSTESDAKNPQKEIRKAAFAEIAAWEAVSKNTQQGLQYLKKLKQPNTQSNLKLQERLSNAVNQQKEVVETFTCSAREHAKGNKKEGAKLWKVANNKTGDLLRELTTDFSKDPSVAAKEAIVQAETHATRFRVRANEIGEGLLKNPSDAEARAAFECADFTAGLLETHLDRLNLRQEIAPLKEQINKDRSRSKAASQAGNRMEARRLESLALAGKVRVELVEHQRNGLTIDPVALQEVNLAIEDWNKAAEAYAQGNEKGGKQYELSAQSRKALFNKVVQKAMYESSIAILKQQFL